MSHKLQIAMMVALLMSALLVIPSLGCAEEGEEGKVTITIGNITDITGPAGPALRDITWALEDIVRYINEEDPIPGVKLKVVSYDTRYDPSRDIPAYEWCKERGAQLIITPLPTTGETLRYSADRDKIPLDTLSATAPVIEPPGWAFAFICPVSYQVKGLLKWLSDQWPNYPTRPKIGSAGWQEPFHIELTNAVEEYCRDHPDKFEYVAGLLSPMGAMTWSGEVEALKNCDYVFPPSTGMGTSTFMTEFRSKGYHATFVGTDALHAFKGLIVDAVGWPDLDGMLTAPAVTLWWNQPFPLVQLAIDLLEAYRPEETEAVLHSPQGYIGGIQQQYFMLDILRKAVEAVGAEDFDGQAYYDAAVTYEMDFEGFPNWSFTQTKRYLTEHIMIYEWSAREGDLVRVSDWLPIVVE